MNTKLSKTQKSSFNIKLLETSLQGYE